MVQNSSSFWIAIPNLLEFIPYLIILIIITYYLLFLFIYCLKGSREMKMSIIIQIRNKYK